MVFKLDTVKWKVAGSLFLATTFLAGCGSDQSKDSVDTESDFKITSPNQASEDSEIVLGGESGNEPIKDSHTAHSVDESTGGVSQSEDNDSLQEEAPIDYELASGNEEDVEKVSFTQQEDSGYIEWSTPETVDYKQADLVVYGPNGQRIERSFSSGEPMVLNESLDDGVYKWESVVSPKVDARTREEMAAVRSSGDSEAEQQLIRRLRSEGALPTEAQSNANRQSGTIIVRDGVAYPSLVDDPGSEENQDG